MNEPSHGPAADDLPVAQITQARAQLWLQSKMWLVTAVCLGIAFYLSWHSWQPPGIEISIEFPDGHGLKAGDSIRHRGITIGHITSVELTADLNGVKTKAMLHHSASAVAKAKSRFWIVRPLLSLTNISGLETAVGSKYVAVSPGPAESEATRHFVGQSEPPPLRLDDSGMEITLKAIESHGLSPGAPVSYRGIHVGQILTVELGDTALKVVIKARIDDQYAHLVRQGSKFWKATGVDLDFGIKGFHLNTDSLSAITRGGVSFITPTSRDEADLSRVEPGAEFELSEELEKNWLRDAASLSKADSAVPEADLSK